MNASGDSVDECTDTYVPDRDGLYALGAWSWTWQEADSEALTPVNAVSHMLARYRAWSTHRHALSAVEDDPGASVSATEWQASDDEAAELARGLARLLSDTRRNAGADLVDGVARLSPTTVPSGRPTGLPASTRRTHL